MADDAVNVTVTRTVTSMDELDAAQQQMSPVLRGILQGLQDEARPNAMPSHIKASFSLSQ